MIIVMIIIKVIEITIILIAITILILETAYSMNFEKSLNYVSYN